MAEHSFLYDNARKYCAYQERCIYDLKKKLMEWNASEKTIASIVKQLEQEGFINEERYAVSFAIGKLRNNKWGKNKIYYALSKKNIPEIYVEMGLNEIDQEEYINTLKSVLASKKINDTDEFRRNNKLVRFAVQKGYQSDLVWKVVRGEL